MRGLEVFAFLFFCTVVSGQNQSKQGDPEYNYEYRKDSFYHVFISGLEADSVLSHTRAIQFFDFLINNRDDCSVTYFGYELGFALKDWGSLELAKKQYEKLLKYAEEGELTEGISHAYKGLGDVAQSAADFEQSINYYLLAENGWIKTRNHQKLGFLYNNIGVSYRKQGNTYMALNYYIKAIEQLQRANDLLALAYINANVGNIYLDQEDYKQALTYYNIGLEAGNEADNQRMIANLANSVGLAYDKLGETVKSFHYFKKAYSNALNSDNKEIILLSLSNLGESYADLEKYDSAIYYIKESLKKSKDLDDAESQTIALLGLGTVYLKQKEFRKAKTYLEEGLKLASNTNQARREATAYEDLSIALEFLGEYDKALLYARKFKHVSDSLSEIKQSNNLKLLQAEFEFESEQEKSNTQIKQLTAENEIQDLRLRERNLFIIISLVTFLAFGIIGYLVYNQRLVKEKKEANDLKQKLLRLQLNPHFTYNSLNAIQSMIYEEEHRQKAADYLAQFSGLMREILELNRKDLVTLEEEISVMKNYVAVQQIRFDSPIQFKLNIDLEVSTEELLVPPMITQPFLENSLEHGFADKSGDWELILNISEKEEELQIEIIDNGVGLVITTSQLSNHESLATKITEERLRILGRKFTSQASLKVFDRSKHGEGQGTRVYIELPMIYD